jgi:hypothetical protein
VICTKNLSFPGDCAQSLADVPFATGCVAKLFSRTRRATLIQGRHRRATWEPTQSRDLPDGREQVKDHERAFKFEPSLPIGAESGDVVAARHYFHFFQTIPPRVPDGRGQNLDSDSLPFVEDGDEVDPSHPGSVFEAHEVATDRGNSFFAARRIAHPGGVKIGRGVRGNQRILPEAAPSCAAWMRTSAGSRSSRSVISTSPAARGAPSRRTRSNICVHILRKPSCPSQHRLSICWRRQLQRRHDRHADAKHKHGRLRSL